MLPYTLRACGITADVQDRDRGQGLPSSVDSDTYARLAAVLNRRQSRLKTAAVEPAPDPVPSTSNAPNAPQYVGRKFASIADITAAGFRRIAACTYQSKVGHAIWELRPAEQDDGYLLVRRREERDVDLRTAEQAVGAGTVAAVEAGIVRMGAKTAAAKFTVSLQNEDATVLADEEMDLDQLARLAREIKMGPAELTYDTWSDGKWALRVRGPKGEYIHEHDATEPGEIGGEKGRSLLEQLEGALNAPIDGEALLDIEAPLPEPEAELPAEAEPDAGGELPKVGQRVLCIRRGQVADAVVLMVHPQQEAVDLMFGGVPAAGGAPMPGGETELGVPMEMLLPGPEPMMDDPFAVDVEPASKNEPVVFEPDGEVETEEEDGDVKIVDAPEESVF